MKAAQIRAYGGSEALELNEVTLPEPKANQILVNVYAAAINPFDIKLMSGAYKENIPLQFPASLGGDFAGKVIKVGNDVAGLKEGDDVYGTALVLNDGSGAFAEKALVKAAHAAAMPTSANFEAAAASVLVGVSAFQGLEEHIGLKGGEKILIHGGAGGIGHLAVQLAKSMGAYVIATAAGKDLEFVKRLGADEAVDYRTEEFEKVAENCDAVFDTVGGEVTARSFGVIKKGGILVSMVGQPSEELAKQHGLRAIGQWTKTSRDHLDHLRDLIDAGKIKVHIDRTFPLDRVREAIDHKIKNHPRGKVVLRMV
jgi:alcohol dehydrogenase